VDCLKSYPSPFAFWKRSYRNLMPSTICSTPIGRATRS
jgi:hypothetical protein